MVSIITEGTKRPGIMKRKSVLRDGRIPNDTPQKVMQVTFALVDLREYEVLPSDNPGGVAGPPLGLGWEIQAEYQMKLDDYEEGRPSRRGQKQLILPISKRIEILREWGYSRKHIIQATKPVNVDRSRRKASVQSMRLDRLQEFLETLHRGTLHVLTFGKRARQERNLILKCHRLDNGLHGCECPTKPFTEEDISLENEAV